MGTNENGFCLKMMPCACGSGGAKIPDLSYEEQEAGFKDEDGRKVYMKTIDLGAVPGPNSTKLVPHGIDNLNSVTNYLSRWKNQRGYHYIGDVHSITYGTIFVIIGDDVLVQTLGANDPSEFTAMITIYYTCTDR